MSDPPDQERHKQALKIIANPTDHQVCEGCGSIVTIRTYSCPNCHGYRFDPDEKRVVTQAKLLASRSSSSVVSSDLQ